LLYVSFPVCGLKIFPFTRDPRSGAREFQSAPSAATPSNLSQAGVSEHVAGVARFESR
jgi:hypothetical protein